MPPGSRPFLRLAYPLVILLSSSTNKLLHIFGFKASDEPSVTEEEINLLIEGFQP